MSAVIEPVVLDGELVMPEPIGKQPEWLSSPASRKLLRVGRRGSKTRFAFQAAILGHGPGWEDNEPKFPGILGGSDVVWIAQDYPNLTRVVWREEIKPRFGHLTQWAKLNERDHALSIEGLGTLFLASAEAIDGIRGMGKNIRGVIVDEAAWLALRTALLNVILPLLLDNDGWLIIMSTTNAGPDGGYDETGAPQVPSYFNVLAKEIQDGQRSEEWDEFTGTAFDNPTLSKRAIEELIAEYPPGSPNLRQEIYAELLETGVGLALPGLSEATHMCPAFSPEPHWTEFAAFDWGFHHPWSFGRYCADEDGAVYKQDTITGRLDLPEAIDAKARAAGFNPQTTNVFAGGDIFRTRLKKGEFAGPTIAEELQKLGWRLIAANDARVAGLNNLRRYTHIDPAKPSARPRFMWMNTPGNKACLAQVARIPLDPDNPEDALKVDADSAGRGGDDSYDETRYGLMSRPIPAKVASAPPSKMANRAYPITVENGRAAKAATPPKTLDELVEWAQSQKKGNQRVPSFTQRVPRR